MKRLFVLWASSLLLLFSSCIKKPGEDVLCSGNGTSAYRPLAAGDSWHYETDSGAILSYDSVIRQSGSSYIIKNFLALNITYCDTLRIASNGDLYISNASLGSEHLITPANPVVGQSWTYTDTTGQVYYESVVSTSATVVTANCLYTNCLEIRDSEIYNLVNVVYYAKGIGVVESNILNNDSLVNVSQLSGVSLH
jgi:hypothetical protein